ncbi:restin homolog isoform X4 [Drosophila mauritiana]|uniref:Restin homolog isoform X4 n=2 Tax=Drosophila mauritiana TaxID=7226 RepID=A0A6P8L064_DROMA|nr:restin homolog isoform X4 [Drosophila mauritiana]
MSDDTSAVGGASAPFPSPVTADPEPGATASKLPGPIRSNIPTPATSGTGIPQPSKMKAPSSFGSTGSVSKIGRPCCNHTTPKSGPPPREAASMSRESDDNLSSINSAYTDNSSAVLTANTEQFIIGQRVWLGGTRPGQIAFIGDTHFAAGEWAGVVLDEPNGKNDGCVSGKRYFQCEPKRGIFSRLTRLTTYPMAGAQTPTSPLAKNSPDRSRTVSPTASIRSSMLRSPGIGGKNGMAVGDRVIVSSGFGSRPGILRYLGETQFAPGNWCGVELDEPSGKNDGTVDDIRYFECKPKYGVFVPIAKVSLSPSSKKTRLSRTGSRESLTSIGTMNSIATTATSRMRMNAQQRKSSTPVKPILATPKSQFSMQDLLREKQQHVEKLMVERDLDREDAQNQALQLQKNINELKARIVELESALGDERKKTEELQCSIDEAQFCGDEMNAQSQVYKEKIHDLESKITKLVSATPSLQSILPPDLPSDDGVLHEEIAQLQEKMTIQQKEVESRIAEQLEEEQRLRENVKYLNEQIATLQSELVSKDEALEKFSLSECGIENLRRELALLKEENEKQAQEAQAEFTRKLAEKSVEMVRLSSELQSLKTASGSLESERVNKTDECEILQTEVRMRDEQIRELTQQLDEVTTQLNVQKADSSALDDMLRLQKEGTEEKSTLLEKTDKELAQIKEEAAKTRQEKEQLEKQISDLKQLAEQEKLVREKTENAINQIQLDKESIEQQLALKQNELEDFQNKQSESAVHLQEIRAQNTQKDLELVESGESLKKLQQQLEEKTLGHEKQHAALEELKKEKETIIKQKEQELQQLQSKSAESESAFKAVQVQLEQLQQQAAASGEEGCKTVAKLHDEISQLKSQAEETQSELKSTQSNLEDKTKQLEAANGSLEEEAKKSGHLQEQITKLKSEVEETQAALSSCHTDVESKTKQLEAANAALEKVNKEYAESRAEASDLQDKVKEITDTLHAELQAERSSSSALHTKLSKFSDEIATGHKELTSKADAWSKEMLQKEKELQELRQQLHDSQDSQTKLKAEGERKEKSFEESIKNLQEEVTKAKTENLELSTGTQTTIKDLQERLEITNAELQHKEKMATEDAQKIADLKTLVEAIQVANANISATNAELSTVLEVLQAEKSETNHIFELFEMEADMNSERLIEKVTGIKEELKETHLQLDERQKKIEELEEKLKQTQQSEQKVQQESQTSKEQLTELHQSLQELQDSVKQKEELVQSLEEKVRESSSIIEGQNTKLNESNVQLENQTSCLKETQDQLLESQKKEKKLQEEAAKLSGELQQVQEANGDIKDSLVKVEELVKVLEEKLQAATSQLESQQATNKKLHELLVKSQENEGNLQGESLAVTEKLHQLEQANGELKEALCQKENGLKELEGKLEESNTLLESQKKSHNEIQDKLEQAQQKERTLQEETAKLAEQLSQLKQVNEELQKSLQQKQLLLEKGNEFDTQLAEYQKVIDEMDDAASVKSKLLEQLQNRVAELEAALRQANDAQKTAYLEAKELRRQLESLELEKSREVLSLKAQMNGASSRIGQGDEVESLDTETSLAKINFLNSIIADMQQKNDALKAKVQTLETLPMDFTKPHAFDALTRRKPAPRLFCDICDEFDRHDTEDCPIQGSEDQDYTTPSSESNNNDKERKLPAPRKYCDSCEVFGHDTSECADDETY